MFNTIKVNNTDTNYTHSIFDISEYTSKTYDTLSDALTDVPDGKQSGGMTVRFVSTSDNKYVQFRCIADAFTTDTTQWAIAEEGVYIENPEFIYVKLDAEGRILWAIRTDGSIYYGAGVPPQIIDYINEKIAELSLDEYEDIVAFLSDYLGGDTTLKAIIDGINAQIATKVDKVEGKSLVDSEYADAKSHTDNPEWLSVTTDSEGRILGGRKGDGTVVENMPQENPAFIEDYNYSNEYIKIEKDSEGKIINSLKTDGTTVVGGVNISQLKNDINTYIKSVQNHNLNGNAIELPEKSSTINIKFTTNDSLYRKGRNTCVLMSSVANIILERKEQGESYYGDMVSSYLRFYSETKNYTVPFYYSYCGKDLFSLRLKYPVVNVLIDGNTEIESYLPSEFEGSYIEKTDTNFIIHLGDGSIYKSFNFSDYSDIDEFVEALKVDSDIISVFEVVKYGCEGITSSQIRNFEKIYICEEIDEIYYRQGPATDQPYPTGKTYWDSYPTIIKTSDAGYEHIIKLSYKVVDGIITYVQVSFDGTYAKFKDIKIPAKHLYLNLASEDMINSGAEIDVLPYNPPVVPIISMQHVVRESDVLIHGTMYTSTMRQYEMLSYLKDKGFVGLNYRECISLLQGNLQLSTPVYCLNFDDDQRSIWLNENIRNLFNQFNARPSLVYLVHAAYLDNETIPDGYITNDEYKKMKMSGWDIISHGFCMHTNRLSYAQFVQGFTKLRSAWRRWYDEELCCYNPHGSDIKRHQYFLLRHLGFYASTAVAQGGSSLPCEAGSKINSQYRRISWMDSELDWDEVKSNIDNW